MNAAIRRRLGRLELSYSHVHHQDTDGSVSAVRSQAFLLAAHLGEYREGESPAVAYARALGYESLQEYKRESQSDGGRWAQRHNAAFERLLQAHGLDRARECGLETWKGLFERVPQGLRDQMHLSL